MTLLLQNLRSNIVGRTANSLLRIALVLNLCRQSKIANLSIHLVVNKNVTQLEIPMDDTLLVYIDDRLHDLTNINPSLELSEPLPSLGEVLQGIIPTILQQDIDVLLILEGIDKLDNMLVLQRLMNLNLNQQLVTLTLLVDRFLRNHLRSIELTILTRHSLVTLRKTTSPQQLTLCVTKILALVPENSLVLVVLDR